MKGLYSIYPKEATSYTPQITYSPYNHVPERSSHLDNLLHMLPHLRLVRPVNKLLPIPTLMLGPKAVHPVDLLVHHLDRRIGMAHEALSQEIDAVSHMTRLDVHRQVVVRQFVSLDSRVVVGPVSLAESVLVTHWSAEGSFIEREKFPYQAMQLVENGKGGSGWGNRWVHEEAAFVGENRAPRPFGVERWRFGEAAIVSEGLRDLVDFCMSTSHLEDRDR